MANNGDGDAVSSKSKSSCSAKARQVKFFDHDNVVYINERSPKDIDRRIDKAQKKIIKKIITNYLRDDRRIKAEENSTEPHASVDVKEEGTSNEASKSNEIPISSNTETNPSGQNNQTVPLRIKETTATNRTNQSGRRTNFLTRVYEVRRFSGSDVEFGSGTMLNNLDNEDRNKFIRTVFCYISVMMLFTVIVTTMVLISPPITQVFKEGFVLFALIGIVCFTIGSFAMTCCAFARHPPMSFYFLILVAIGCTMLVCTSAIIGKQSSVFLAAMVTLAVCIVCYLLALTNFDFTKFYILLIVFGLVLVFVSLGSVILVMLGYPYKPIFFVVNLVSALFYSFGIVIELQMLFGSRALEFDDSQTAYAAYRLYSSVIFLFLRILQIFQLLDMD